MNLNNGTRVYPRTGGSQRNSVWVLNVDSVFRCTEEEKIEYNNNAGIQQQQQPALPNDEQKQQEQADGGEQQPQRRRASTNPYGRRGRPDVQVAFIRDEAHDEEKSGRQRADEKEEKEHKYSAEEESAMRAQEQAKRLQNDQEQLDLAEESFRSIQPRLNVVNNPHLNDFSIIASRLHDISVKVSRAVISLQTYNPQSRLLQRARDLHSRVKTYITDDIRAAMA
jgi:hypothetical protein